MQKSVSNWSEEKFKFKVAVIFSTTYDESISKLQENKAIHL